jgi:hypothetical protein
MTAAAYSLSDFDYDFDSDSMSANTRLLCQPERSLRMSGGAHSPPAAGRHVHTAHREPSRSSQFQDASARTPDVAGGQRDIPGPNDGSIDRTQG